MCIVFSAALHWRQALVQEIFIMKEYDALSEVKNWNKVNQLKFITHSNTEICKFGLFKRSYKFEQDSLKKITRKTVYLWYMTKMLQWKWNLKTEWRELIMQIARLR